ncbi:MAG: murein biosynthesis integral membrane protein MurJ [Alphaproteobacteria bacterium]|nr:murein biosynthesis integral membrane protein MurJ [Alphaproteobacteria bacterium]
MGTAALIVSGGVLLSRVLGVIRESIFAGLLGADAVTDQYVAAFRIPDFMNYLLAGGFLSITFIPIFSRYLAEQDEAGGWEALTAIIRPIAIAIVGLVAIGWVAAPPVIETIYPDFTAEQIATTVRLTRIVLPAQIFFVLGALFTAVQYAKGVFAIPSIAPIAYNLGIIVGGVGYAWATGDPDPEGFVWGAVAGAFVGNFALQWWGARQVGMRMTRGLPWRHPVLREYLLIAIPLMLGQSIVVLDETFMSVFGDLVGDGVQTHLQYARRTMLVPVGVIAQAASVAAYPFLARLFAEGRERELAATVDRALRWVIVLSMAAAALLMAMSVPIIRILFERAAFTVADTAASAAGLFFYALAVPIWGALQILNRAFYARRDMWTPVVVGTAMTVLAIPIYIVLQRGYGLDGVAMASVISLGLYAAALGWRWYAHPQVEGRFDRVVESAGRAVPLTVIGGAGAFGTAWSIEWLLGAGFLATLVGAIAGGAVFASLALGLGTKLYDWLTPTATSASAEE